MAVLLKTVWGQLRPAHAGGWRMRMRDSRIVGLHDVQPAAPFRCDLREKPGVRRIQMQPTWRSGASHHGKLTMKYGPRSPGYTHVVHAPVSMFSSHFFPRALRRANCKRVHRVSGQSGGTHADGEAAPDAVDEARGPSAAPGAGAGAE